MFAYLYSCYLLRACTVYHRIGSIIYCCSSNKYVSQHYANRLRVRRRRRDPKATGAEHQDDTIEPIERDDVLGVSLGRLKNLKNYTYTRARRVCDLGTLNIVLMNKYNM